MGRSVRTTYTHPPQAQWAGLQSLRLLRDFGVLGPRGVSLPPLKVVLGCRPRPKKPVECNVRLRVVARHEVVVEPVPVPTSRRVAKAVVSHLQDRSDTERAQAEPDSKNRSSSYHRSNRAKEFAV